MTGNVPAAIRGERPLGPAEADRPMERMIMVLRMAPEARARLDQFLAEVQNPASQRYHAWLQPESFAAAFGPAPGEVAQVTAWLKSQGFTVDAVARSGLSLQFSGTVDMVQRAFRTPIQRFRLGGQEHQANALDPSIPAELAGTVAGLVSLHDLPRKAANLGARPLYTSASGNHYLAPADFAAIYDLAPLFAQGNDGTGVSIAIAGRSNPGLTDVTAFRTLFQLPAGHTQILANGPDPGSLSSDEDLEADLDMEWAGATAPGASIQFVCSASTAASDGVDLSAAYAVDNNLAPVLTVSFGSCEAQMGSAELTFYQNLWDQAAAQGMTVCVAAGDSGAAGCDGGSDTTGSGRAVNGLGSTPSNTCVGGTEFNEGSGTYWSVQNSAVEGSVLGYLPELAWNESGTQAQGSGLWAGGGGVSQVYPKPFWQVASGVPADGRRDVPDVALAAASHDGYLVRAGGSLASVGGTSAATPAFAGIMALVVQKYGQRQGNANPLLYTLAGSSAFHDVVGGSNSVPGTEGFPAGPGYDLATGLGSVDASALVASTQSGQVSVTLPAGSVGQLAGSTATYAATVAGAMDTAATWSASGGTLTAVPPAGATFTAPAGTYTLTAASVANPARTAKVTVQVHDGDFMNGHAGKALTGLDALYLVGAEGTRNPALDLNGDGAVDDLDLNVLLAALGW